MSEHTSHPAGTFCWPELATSDQKAAVSFYRRLFGWDLNDIPMGPAGTYSIFQMRGQDVAAAAGLQPEERQHGVPPHWNSYVSVDNADQSVKRAQELGAKVLAPPFDVMDSGRMAVLQDPTGAIFNVWEPRSHHGTGIYGIQGTLCWADLSTPDVEVAKLFYEKVFDWNVTPGEKDPSGYLHIQNGEHYIGGIPPCRDAKTPPHWLIYFHVDNADAATAKAKELGARVYMEPMTMEGVGRWSVVADPQGAVFALFQPPADHK